MVSVAILLGSLAASAVAMPTAPEFSATFNAIKGNVIAHVRSKTPIAVADPPLIAYNYGAPVLTNPVNLYYIYYGSWNDGQKSILEDFARGLGTSDWYGITKKYYYQQDANSQRVYVDGCVTLAGTVVDNYSQGSALSGNALPNIIQSQINAGALAEDTNGIYIVLTSGDVTESMRPDFGSYSFCKDYCGYHASWQLNSGNRIYYAMVGNPSACINSCATYNNQGTSPNGDNGVDAAISVLAHEITEAVSDPWSDGNRAWQDSQGYEDGDKCAWNFGSTQTDSNGAIFNANWNGRNFLIQQNWDPDYQSCRMFA